MKKILLFIICFITLSNIVSAGELYYYGGYNSAYVYDAKVFEQHFLKKTAKQACSQGAYTDSMCIKMYNRNVADYKSGKCKLINDEIYKKLKQAQIQNNRQHYYQILNSIN